MELLLAHHKQTAINLKINEDKGHLWVTPAVPKFNHSLINVSFHEGRELLPITEKVPHLIRDFTT